MGFGGPAALVDALLEPDDSADDGLVLPENWPAVELFLACATQWHRAGMAGLPTGLDYVALEAAMRMTGVADTDRPELFAAVRIIEHAALPILLESRKR